jgi:hypothetical protein
MNITEFLADLKAWWQLRSIQLAGLIAALSGVLTANPELLVGLLGVIPVDPWIRLAFSVGVGGVVFFVPFIARVWPQDITIPKEKSDGEQ